MADSNFNFMNVLSNILPMSGRYNAQGQWVTDDGTVADPYTGEALDPLLEQIKDTSELSPAEQDQLLGAQMGPSNSPYTIPDPIDTLNANTNLVDSVSDGSIIDPNSDVLDIVRGIAEDNPIQDAAINQPVEPTQLPKVDDWASRFQEPIPDRPYVPVEGEDDLIMEPDSEFEPVETPETDVYDLLGLSRRERRKLQKGMLEERDVKTEEEEERPGKLDEGTTPWEGRLQGDLDGDGYIDEEYLPQDTPASEEDLKGPNVEDAPVTDKGDVTSTKKESTQQKSDDLIARANEINRKYEAGEINRFQRNRLNRQLRRDVHKSGGRKNLPQDVVKNMAGPVGRFMRNLPKNLAGAGRMVKEYYPKILELELQKAAADAQAGQGFPQGQQQNNQLQGFNQSVNLNPVTNPYYNLLMKMMGGDKI